MRALCVKAEGGLEMRDVPKPSAPPPPEHLLLQMEASPINPGDIAFLGRATPMGLPLSQGNVWGVSGIGKVVELGEQVPEFYRGQKVIVYRSLVKSQHIVGTWSEYAQMHYLSCAVVPQSFGPDHYGCSLVNVITTYAFAQQALAEGHRAVLVTAGNSATGLAMLGIGQSLGLPIVSIVRNQKGKAKLVDLGATNVLDLTDPDFDPNLTSLCQRLGATCVFDGVGGDLVGRIAPVLPLSATIYSYGYLGGMKPVIVAPTVLMAKDLTLKSFSNFRSATVQDPKKLADALADISRLIHLPHFKVKSGNTFSFEQIEEAMKYKGPEGEKAILHS
jgi:NADPH2:quinone reductase